MEAWPDGVHNHNDNLDFYGRDDRIGLQHRFDGNVRGGLLSDTWVSSSGTHFDGVTAMPAWLNWAGAPFVTPGNITYVYPSVLYLRMTNAVAERSFLYTPVTATNSLNIYLKGGLQALGNGVSGTGTFWGYRIDDGSDNNYVEGGLVTCYDATATMAVYARQWFRSYRTGGGVVTTIYSNTLLTPPDCHFFGSVGGTLWTNWYCTTLVYGHDHASYSVYWMPNATPSGLGWTPTRAGILFDRRSVSTWHSLKIDAVKITQS
jgi:hypothetical protein